MSLLLRQLFQRQNVSHVWKRYSPLRATTWSQTKAKLPTCSSTMFFSSAPTLRSTVSGSRREETLAEWLTQVDAQFQTATARSNYQSLAQQAQHLEDFLKGDTVWIDNRSEAHRKMVSLSQLNKRLHRFNDISNAVNNLREYADLVRVEIVDGDEESGDLSLLDDFEIDAQNVLEKLESFIDNSLVDPSTEDAADALLIIEAGNGGLDAKDWVAMVRHMYSTWATNSGFEVVEVAVVPDSVAGLRSCIMEVRNSTDADCAYGWTKSEMGVHKLVRFSPFDKNQRRQTSHAKVAVLPIDSNEEQEFELDKRDLKIDRFRASGSGGQHTNVTESAIRVTHLPTGVTASAQERRCQHANLTTAMQRLRDKIRVNIEREKYEKAKDLKTLLEIFLFQTLFSHLISINKIHQKPPL